MTTQELDALVQRTSAFTTFQELLDTPRHYRPTILVRNVDTWTLAQAYDAAQAARGDARRAFRGTTSKFVAPKEGVAYPKVGDSIYFWANIRRHGVIEAVGPKRVRTSYVTKREVRDAKRFGFTPRSSTRTFRIDTLTLRGGWDGVGWQA